MKFIFIVLMILFAGVVLGYIKPESDRASVKMGDFDLKIPDKDDN